MESMVDVGIAIGENLAWTEGLPAKVRGAVLFSLQGVLWNLHGNLLTSPGEMADASTVLDQSTTREVVREFSCDYPFHYLFQYQKSLIGRVSNIVQKRKHEGSFFQEDDFLNQVLSPPGRLQPQCCITEQGVKDWQVHCRCFYLDSTCCIGCALPYLTNLLNSFGQPPTQLIATCSFSRGRCELVLEGSFKFCINKNS